jgi:3-oxoacyl-[acyl-carrier-protein] synthase-3
LRIKSSFAYLPPRILTNEDLLEASSDAPSASGDTPEDAALTRISRGTGLQKRRYALGTQCTSDLAIAALEPWCQKFPEHAAQLQALLVATTSGDSPSPATAHAVHRGLKLSPHTWACDVASSCTSFLSALVLANNLGGNATPQNLSGVVVVAAEVKHKHLPTNNLVTQALFGDGAAGIYLEPSSDGSTSSGLTLAYSCTDNHLIENIRIPVGGSREPTTVHNLPGTKLSLQEPKGMYMHLVQRLEEAILACAARAAQDYPEHPLGPIYVHQANRHALVELRRRLPTHLAKRLWVLMADVGNTVCAALPLVRVRSLLFEAWQNHALEISPSPAGRVYHATVRGESVTLVDAATKTGAGETPHWLEMLDAQEHQWGLEVLSTLKEEVAQKTPVEIWVAAGGGFQTLGLLNLSC